MRGHPRPLDTFDTFRAVTNMHTYYSHKSPFWLFRFTERILFGLVFKARRELKKAKCLAKIAYL